jgi:glyoxylase-like metal-dependent hydrolase (beta-lactamase superfamily II)
VAGDRRTLWLDAGSSAMHARGFLDWLSAQGVQPPAFVVLTHSHWDHVFGAAELGAIVVAHSLTAEALRALADTDWSDEALDSRVAGGEVSAAHAEHVKEELPSPRDVWIAPADVVFEDGLDVDLGEVKVRVRHVGGDHALDSCVMYVEPDGVLFLGDCLYDSPAGGITAVRAVPLHEEILGFGAEVFVEGHSERVLTHTDAEEVIRQAQAQLA